MYLKKEKDSLFYFQFRTDKTKVELRYEMKFIR
jgi:hypothetical protein